MDKLVCILILVFASQMLVWSQILPVSEYGEFTGNFSEVERTLRFNRDSFYYYLTVIGCSGSSEYQKINGTYKQVGKRIKFKPVFSEKKTYAGKLIISDNPEKIYEFNAEFELLLLDSFVLLLRIDSIFPTRYPAMRSNNDYLRLICKINEVGKASFGGMWTNYKGKKFPIFDKNFKEKLPKKWKKYLLDESIEAQIIDSLYLEVEDRPGWHYSIQYIVTLDKGKKDGIMNGLKLFCEEAQLRITEVNRKTSKAYLHCMPYRRQYFLDSGRVYSTQNKRLINFGK